MVRPFEEARQFTAFFTHREVCDRVDAQSGSASSEIRKCVAYAAYNLDRVMGANRIPYAVVGSIGAFAHSGVEPRLLRGRFPDGRPKGVDIDYLLFPGTPNDGEKLKYACDEAWQGGVDQGVGIEVSPVNLPSHLANDPKSVLNIKWEPGFLEVSGNRVIDQDSPLASAMKPVIADIFGQPVATLSPLGQIVFKLAYLKYHPIHRPTRLVQQLRAIQSLLPLVDQIQRETIDSIFTGRGNIFTRSLIHKI